ncbi:hypothetical protein FKW77_007748 [Venturia effusa]|uniref:Uncharacterized protein n=1 Tax=Venturia effusa TaxID=50376 RepID=A0A517LCS9_9PEZI|nr:hypothetical protein FKW77_007748 [Venturia effusa]
MKLLYFLCAAMSIIACVAEAVNSTDYIQMLKNKGVEIIKDLAAGRTNDAMLAPPSLTGEQQKGFMEMVRSFGLEQLVFDKFAPEVIHGHSPGDIEAGTGFGGRSAADLRNKAQKKWEMSVDNWAGFADKAFKHRKLQAKTLLELNKGTRGLLHAMYDIDQSTTLPSGLDARTAVGILVHDNIEALRQQASPYKKSQSPKAQSKALKSLRSRQQHAAVIIRGILEEIPEALELLNDDLVDIIGRNEIQRGDGYFMKTYAGHHLNGSKNETSIIQRIAALYQDLQHEPAEERQARHAKSMDALLLALSAPDESSTQGNETAEQMVKQWVWTDLPQPSSRHRNSTTVMPSTMSILTLTSPVAVLVPDYTTYTISPLPSIAPHDIAGPGIFQPPFPNSTFRAFKSTPSAILAVASTRNASMSSGPMVSAVAIGHDTTSLTRESFSKIVDAANNASGATPSFPFNRSSLSSARVSGSRAIIPIPIPASKDKQPDYVIHRGQQHRDGVAKEQGKEQKKRKSRDLGLIIGLPLGGATAAVAMMEWGVTKPIAEVLRISHHLALDGMDLIHRASKLLKYARTGHGDALLMTEIFGMVANEFAMDGVFDVVSNTANIAGSTADLAGSTADLAASVVDHGIQVGEAYLEFVPTGLKIASGVFQRAFNWLSSILLGKGTGGRLVEESLAQIGKEHSTSRGLAEHWLHNLYEVTDGVPTRLEEIAEQARQLDNIHFDDAVRKARWIKHRDEWAEEGVPLEWTLMNEDSQVSIDPEMYGLQAPAWEGHLFSWLTRPERYMEPWEDRLRWYNKYFEEPGPHVMHPNSDVSSFDLNAEPKPVADQGKSPSEGRPDTPNGSNSAGPTGQGSRPEPTQAPQKPDPTQRMGPNQDDNMTGGSEHTRIDDTADSPAVTPIAAPIQKTSSSQGSSMVSGKNSAQWKVIAASSTSTFGRKEPQITTSSENSTTSATVNSAPVGHDLGAAKTWIDETTVTTTATSSAWVSRDFGPASRDVSAG